MKLNLPKPLIKYLLIALSAAIGFLLIYTYVKFTNDRVYEFAKEQVVNSEVKPELIKEAIGAEIPPENLVNDIQPNVKPLPGSEAFRVDVKSVENKKTGKRLIAGKTAHACMHELNTQVINNDVVKCTHDHYVSP